MLVSQLVSPAELGSLSVADREVLLDIVNAELLKAMKDEAFRQSILPKVKDFVRGVQERCAAKK